MGLHRLEIAQAFPVGIEEAWEFFSNPRNLGIITPPDLGFELTSDVPEHIYPGLLIAYRVRPLFGLPVRWLTEIKHVHEVRLFVDGQRMGPYRFWHHEHHFREFEGGVMVRDLIHYALPFGLLGDALNAALVRQRLGHIFEFRRVVLEQRFGYLQVPGG